MDGQIGWGELFLNPQGRLARTPFLIGAAVLIAIAAIYESWVTSALHWLTGLFVYGLLLYSGACLLSKRLHDRGRSGWWAALILFALAAAWPHPRGNFGGLVFTLILIWAAIELGAMHGEDGANRFGPSPLAQGA